VDLNKLPELTSEEERKAILDARKSKYAAIELERTRKEYWEKLTKETPAPNFTAEQLRNKLAASITVDQKRFVIDSDNKAIVNALCLYFSNDPRLLEYGLSHDKGLLIMGGKGVGKTHLMSFFFKNRKASYVMAPCVEIENKWRKSEPDKGDPDFVEYYSNLIPCAINSDPFGHQQIGVCFDDLGTETIPAVRYGEKKNILQEIVQTRYSNKNFIHFALTHATTNLNEDGISEKYGDRVLDRLHEMCNILVFPNNAKSRRRE
jgi:DNA replication protein DnaC